jgi:hypothetical protein
MKKLVSTVLSLCLILSSTQGLAQEKSNSQIKLIDQYVERYNKADADGEWAQFAKRRYNEAVAAQLATLDPEDFNLFMLYLLSERYFKSPSERKAINDLLNAIPKAIPGDIQITGVLDRKAWLEYQSPSWAEWSIKFAAIAAISVLPWKRILSGPSSGPRFLQSLSNLDTNLRASGGLAGGTYSWLINRWVLGGVAGGLGVQYLSYEFAQRRTYRNNPQPMLALVQLGLACDLEIKTDELYERFRKNKRDKSILPDIDSALEQGKLLSTQNPELNSFPIRDERISETVRKFPSEMSTELQQRLGSTMDSRDRTCSQVSLLAVAARLMEMKLELDPPKEEEQP